ncbi:MAG: 30S ribosome-binding factor RbfA [Actinobacteria bacterium]|nr:30S ribosome-binding factor RbfA [Actinomycetota bacterium]
MESARTHRVGELIKEEISDIIKKELKDPRIGFVTITGVDVTPDLRYANVFISVLGARKQKEETLKGLQSASGFLRNMLSKRIRIKYLPELRFTFDPSIEAGIRIEKVIRKLREKEEEHG